MEIIISSASHKKNELASTVDVEKQTKTNKEGLQYEITGTSKESTASYPMGAGVSFPGGKARPRRDADHSPPSSAEVKYEY
jgi:hypothetical protein